MADFVNCDGPMPDTYCLDQFAAGVAALRDCCQPCRDLVMGATELSAKRKLPWAPDLRPATVELVSPRDIKATADHYAALAAEAVES